MLGDVFLSCCCPIRLLYIMYARARCRIFSLDYRQLHALKCMAGKMLLIFAGLQLFRNRIKADFVRINKEIN